MKRLWKYLKKALKWTVFLLLFLIIVGILFLNLSPEFGGDPTDADIEKYKKTGHYKEGKFKNYSHTPMEFTFGKIVEIVGDYLDDSVKNIPIKPLIVVKQDSLILERQKKQDNLIWFGHSAFFLQLEGKNILLDPMFGDVPSPVSFAAKSRFFKELPISIEKLPTIDFVFISHDHYDHLDYGSIQKLKTKTKSFILPLGVGVHFREWGIKDSCIFEYNWWEEDTIDGLSFVFTPSRHFSGRGLLNKNSTLWGSWVIKGGNKSLFFSGDGGYDNHFKKIGERYGPFDVAMVECGQYNKYWKNIHMVPEESARAMKDLNAKVGIPIHWGAFSLSTHMWSESPVRIKRAADSLGVFIATPQIGEVMNIDSNTVGYNPWWEKFQ
ncbi:MAG: hypothetical protein CMP67_07280 [Flavobacteriales bacterium]|nr:hypothetical protein [Flavobacteriales bacterium]|tara:strand:- start:377 stop:1516 length:1140 start_codon:yes stop_codon:yes gene_type:complete